MKRIIFSLIFLSLTSCAFKPYSTLFDTKNLEYSLDSLGTSHNLIYPDTLNWMKTAYSVEGIPYRQYINLAEFKRIRYITIIGKSDEDSLYQINFRIEHE